MHTYGAAAELVITQGAVLQLIAPPRSNASRANIYFVRRHVRLHGGLGTRSGP